MQGFKRTRFFTITDPVWYHESEPDWTERDILHRVDQLGIPCEITRQGVFAENKLIGKEVKVC